MSQWYMYVLRCNDDSLYTGVTTDLQRRVDEHNQCNTKGANYTRARRPVQLIYWEPFSNRAQAQQREAAVKKLSKQKKEILVS